LKVVACDKKIKEIYSNNDKAVAKKVEKKETAFEDVDN